VCKSFEPKGRATRITAVEKNSLREKIPHCSHETVTFSS
jgi:hypothetical protein